MFDDGKWAVESTISPQENLTNSKYYGGKCGGNKDVWGWGGTAAAAAVVVVVVVVVKRRR